MTASIPIGTHGHWPLKRTLSLTPKAAAMHWHIIGTTGSGKSTFLINLFLHLLKAGMSATLIDPHGDLCKDILEQLAGSGYFEQPEAFSKLLYLDLPDAAQREFYLPFNILKQPYKHDGIADNIVKTMHAAWKELDQGAAMFDVIVDAGIKTLLANNLPITSLHRVINVKDYRDALLTNVQIPEVLDFWHNQFDRMAPKDQADQAGAASRRAYQLTKTDVLKYSLGQDENALDFRRLLDQNISTIINLHVDGDGVQELLGSLLTSMAVAGAKSRSQIARSARTHNHFLLIDEFEKFTDKSGKAMTNMLSETRKYGMFLVVAHQDWAQARDLIDALQNCGIDMAFRLGPLDAKTSAQMLARVDTKSVSQEVDETREAVGMNEQWEEMRQELMELYPGQVYLRKDLTQLPFGLKHLWKRRRSALYKIKTFLPPRVQVDTRAIEDRYIEMYFRHRSTIEPLLASRREMGAVTVVPAARSRRAA